MHIRPWAALDMATLVVVASGALPQILKLTARPPSASLAVEGAGALKAEGIFVHAKRNIKPGL